MEKREGLIVYRKRNIDKVAGFVDNLKRKGIATAQKLALTISILEARKSLRGYIEEEGKEEDVQWHINRFTR